MSIPSLSEIAGYEDFEITSLADIKIKCLEFALDMYKSGIYKTNDPLKEAVRIYNWVMQDEPANTEN